MAQERAKGHTAAFLGFLVRSPALAPLRSRRPGRSRATKCSRGPRVRFQKDRQTREQGLCVLRCRRQVAFTCDVVDVAAHIVVCCGLLHTHFGVSGVRVAPGVARVRSVGPVAAVELGARASVPSLTLCQVGLHVPHGVLHGVEGAGVAIAVSPEADTAASRGLGAEGWQQRHHRVAARSRRTAVVHGPAWLVAMCRSCRRWLRHWLRC
jgi:hypothetical protein